jgi:hypothetical protein
MEAWGHPLATFFCAENVIPVVKWLDLRDFGRVPNVTGRTMIYVGSLYTMYCVMTRLAKAVTIDDGRRSSCISMLSFCQRNH